MLLFVSLLTVVVLGRVEVLGIESESFLIVALLFLWLYVAGVIGLGWTVWLRHRLKA